MDEEQVLAMLQEELPDYEDESMLEYMAGMLVEYTPDLDDDILSFMDGYADDDAAAQAILNRIKLRLHGNTTETDDVTEPSDGVTALLNQPVIMAKDAQAHEANLADTVDLMANTQVRTNEAMQSWADDDDVAESAEAMERMAKLKKKSAKREKKQLKRERTVAPKRTAILESLTTRPVVIHSVMGEDGSYGGSPCVDIHLNDMNIDLAGLTILEDANLTLVYGRKYGLVGRNGVGKTTFLKHIAGKALDGIPWYLQILHIEQEVAECDTSALQLVLECDEERENLLKERDAIERALETDPKAKTVEGHEQDEGMDLLDRLAAVYDRLEEIDADRAPARAATILAGLSFTTQMMEKPMREFSGGWRMRVSLARALFIEPDVLLLDEPTNHLDLHAVMWLEDYLRDYDNTVIIVSHARGFLNSVCTDVLEMKSHKIKRYKGNYDSYEEQMTQRAAQDERTRESADKKRSQMEAFIARNIGGGAKGASMAKSRQKMLEKMAAVPDAVANDPTVRFKFPVPGNVSGGFGIRLVGVGFHYPNAPLLFTGVDFSINQNSRICLVGPNGIGKSTLLKIVYQELDPTEGMVTRNQRLRVGRFSQHHVDELKDKKSSLEKFRELYPADPPQKIRKHLGSMGVTGDMQLRPINTLSGGQRSRVAIALITYEEPHLLLLDEVTNHLDLDTVQALIQALAEYQGGVMIVSHDEHLITAVCDELWIIRDKQVILSKGTVHACKPIYPELQRHSGRTGDFADYKKEVLKVFHEPKKGKGKKRN
eukprot:TRINITY_DN9987_c0_g1_i1.p1 TRINITY_DN9987_c0_g1~~TRINITY_DN9987_c0_g1_i1.p1  ORF type:complete len:770 (+),score=186.99 TRINITY_DN9987_c0_g1_i1:53-2362(+)